MRKAGCTSEFGRMETRSLRSSQGFVASFNVGTRTRWRSAGPSIRLPAPASGRRWSAMCLVAAASSGSLGLRTKRRQIQLARRSPRSLLPAAGQRPQAVLLVAHLGMHQRAVDHLQGLRQVRFARSLALAGRLARRLAEDLEEVVVDVGARQAASPACRPAGRRTSRPRRSPGRSRRATARPTSSRVLACEKYFSSSLLNSFLRELS